MRILFYLLLAIIISCNDNKRSNTDNSAPFSDNIHVDDDFYFEKGIYQVVDNVYVAIGYGLANSILIVGDTGNIIIDTTEDPELGKQITLNRVLLLNDEGNVLIGKPYLESVKIKGKILEHLRGKKTIVYKMRPKKKTRKKQGHRQELTRVFIEDIVIN